MSVGKRSVEAWRENAAVTGVTLFGQPGARLATNHRAPCFGIRKRNGEARADAGLVEGARVLLELHRAARQPADPRRESAWLFPSALGEGTRSSKNAEKEKYGMPSKRKYFLNIYSK